MSNWETTHLAVLARDGETDALGYPDNGGVDPHHPAPGVHQGRAEGLYVKATELCPDEGDAWVSLGVVRMRMHNASGARAAYKSALSAYNDNLKGDPSNSAFVIRKVYVLVLLGRADEARASMDDARSRFPDDRRLRTFVESRGLEKMMADPGLKDLTP